VKAITPLAKSATYTLSKDDHRADDTNQPITPAVLVPAGHAVAQSPAPQEEFEKSIPGQSLVPATSETELDRRPMYAAV
jgi:hypothetical protein